MMTLTGKQKRALRSRGQTMADDCRIGKAGLTDSFIEHLGDLLDRKELVKMRFTDVEGPERQLLADEVCQAVGAQNIAVVGRTVLLYRQRSDDTQAPD